MNALKTVAALGVLGSLLAPLGACGSSDDSAASGAPSDGGGGGFPGTGGSGAASGGSTMSDSGPPPPPPEQEVESSFRAPVTTGRYVWSANPDSGRVALIDAVTLELTIAEAGFGPTYLAALSPADDDDSDAAIVLNVLSHDATVFRRKAGGGLDTLTLPTHQGANSWAVSHDGSWAIAWTDAARIEKPDPTDGFQDVTVLSLTPGKESSTRLSVGYRPTSVVIAQDAKRAFAITEPGISVIALSAAPSVTALFEVTDDPLADPASRDVSVTPDGALALVRRDGSSAVGFVDLETGARTERPLGGPITDLDLHPDGKIALAVVREKSELWVLPIPEAQTDPSAGDMLAIPTETFGSVSASEDGSTALLFTNATPNDRLSIVDLRAGADYLTHRTVSIKSPVLAVFPAADGQHALALGTVPQSSTKQGAFSVIPTTKLLSPKVVGTDAPPVAVALSPAPTTRGLIAIRDEQKKKYGVYVARMPSLQVDLIPLASPPLSTGMLPQAKRGYVAQKHPEGRITFIDLEDGSARTLTGFELGAKVVD
ncbi:MAG: hypothetical protein KF718_29715 [Polyangiaceae bacterium]|nr:hypothetical protein [Polyangiaceae bacterium]